jgi:hypothetical protein
MCSYSSCAANVSAKELAYRTHTLQGLEESLSRYRIDQVLLAGLKATGNWSDQWTLRMLKAEKEGPSTRALDAALEYSVYAIFLT